MIVDQIEASNLLCPMRLSNESRSRSEACDGRACMAWRPIPAPGVGLDDRKGYCGMAGAPGDVVIQSAITVAGLMRKGGVKP